MLTLSKCLDDEGETQKRHEHAVELVESAEDSAKALEATEQSLDLVAPTIPGFAEGPRLNAGRKRGNDRLEADVEHPLAGFVALVGPIHDHTAALGQVLQCTQQLASGWRIMGLAKGEGERHGRAGIRGNQMNFCGPTAAGLPDGLGSVFFSAPVPSG